MILYDLERIFRSIVKITLTDELEILDENIKANQDQYNLNREAPKIFVWSPKKLDKYEYLTGEDFGYKLGVVEETKFDYSRLGTVFNRERDKSDKKRKTFEETKKYCKITIKSR